jgi:hypothetical protein
MGGQIAANSPIINQQGGKSCPLAALFTALIGRQLAGRNAG